MCSAEATEVSLYSSGDCVSGHMRWGHSSVPAELAAALGGQARGTVGKCATTGASKGLSVRVPSSPSADKTLWCHRAPASEAVKVQAAPLTCLVSWPPFPRCQEPTTAPIPAPKPAHCTSERLCLWRWGLSKGVKAK